MNLGDSSEAIPQANPGAAYLAHRAEMDEAVQRVLASGWYILGAEVKAFEHEYAAWMQIRQVIGVGSGTDAITLMLRTLNIGPGDEVITSPHTATATVSAIELAGATPVLVDIDPERYTLDPRQVEAAITASTRALMPVHLFGMPADLDPLLELSRRHNLHLLEDCAQAHGAYYKDRKVGTFGRMSIFSFYPTKNLGALGDGGAVVTDDPDLAERARSLAQYGWKQRYISEEAGMNTRLDEIQAAMLRVKLRHLDADNNRRLQIAQRYTEALQNVLSVPHVPEACRPVFHLYVIRHPRRDDLRRYLADHKIGTAIHYPVPLHLQPAYRGVLGDEGSFPCAEKAAHEILSLPLYPELTDAQVERVIEAILNYTHQV